MLAPLLPLLTDGDDPLVRLNVLELLQGVCGTAVRRVALASRLLLPPLHARRMHTACTRHAHGARTHTTHTTHTIHTTHTTHTTHATHATHATHVHVHLAGGLRVARGG